MACDHKMINLFFPQKFSVRSKFHTYSVGDVRFSGAEIVCGYFPINFASCFCIFSALNYYFVKAEAYNLTKGNTTPWVFFKIVQVVPNLAKRLIYSTKFFPRICTFSKVIRKKKSIKTIFLIKILYEQQLVK